MDSVFFWIVFAVIYLILIGANVIRTIDDLLMYLFIAFNLYLYITEKRLSLNFLFSAICVLCYTVYKMISV